jgi:hypothetical protein
MDKDTELQQAILEELDYEPSINSGKNEASVPWPISRGETELARGVGIT